MGWSLSHLQHPNPKLVDSALLAAGKALHLANAFESKCKFVLRIAKLDSYCELRPDATLPDAIASLSRDKLLAPTIAELKLFPPVSAKEVIALEKAREARNFIAHEGALFGSIWNARERSVLEHLTKLRAAVAELAHGDDVVSRWVYEIEEKEVPSKQLLANYAELVDAWIFGDKPA